MNFKAANFISLIFLVYIRNINDHLGKLKLIYYLHFIFRNHIKVKSENGTVLQLIPKDYISGNILFNKTYEPMSLKLVMELLNNNVGAFLDIGANIGLYTCAIAKTYPDKQVISIEPEENNFKLLNTNISLNNPNNKIITLNFAVGACAKIVHLERPIKGNNGTFRVVNDKNFDRMQSKYYPMFDLKTLLQELDIKKISLMKIDIEGYEMEALKGMDWSNANKPQNIVMEYSDYVNRMGISAEEILNYLTEKGYKAYSVKKKPYVKGDKLPEDNLWLSLL